MRSTKIIIGPLLAFALIVTLIPRPSFSTAHAQTAQPPARIDPRWLALVEGESFAQRANTQAAAGIGSLHVNLYASAVGESISVIGRVSGAEPISVTVLRAGAIVTAALAGVSPIGDGFLYNAALCCNLRTGDSVRVTQGADVLTLTLQMLNTQVDLGADVIRGNAAPNAALRAVVYATPEQVTPIGVAGTATDIGAYSLSLAGTADLRAGVTGYVLHQVSAVTSIAREFRVAKLRVGTQPNAPFGFVFQGFSSGLMTATLTSGQIATATLEGFTFISTWLPQQFSTLLTDTVRTLTLTLDGQTVAFSPEPLVTSYETPALKVSGKTNPNRDVAAFVRSTWRDKSLPAINIPADGKSRSDSTGNFTLTLPSRLIGEQVLVVQVTSPDGHDTYATIDRDSFSLQLVAPTRTVYNNPYYQSPNISARVLEARTPVTVTLIGPSQLPKSSFTIFSNDDGDLTQRFIPTYQSGLRIDSNDTLLIRTPTRALTIPIPILNASFDAKTSLLTGMGLPVSQIEVVAIVQYATESSPYPEAPPPIISTPSPLRTAGQPPSPGQYPVLIQMPFVVTTTASGVFSLNLAAFPAVAHPSTLNLQMLDSNGNLFWRTINGDPAQTRCPRLRQIEVGGSFVSISTDCPQQYAQAIVRLFGPTGIYRAEMPSVQNFANPNYLISPDGTRAVINPGDVVELNSTTPQTVTVPQLAVILDASGNAVGSAPPGAVVTLTREYLYFSAENFPFEDTGTVVTVTADATGAFRAAIVLRPGEGVAASLPGAENVLFVARATRQGLAAKIGEVNFGVRVKPYEVFSITISSPYTRSVTRFTGIADGAGRAQRYQFVTQTSPDMALRGGETITLAATQGRQTVLSIPALSLQLDGSPPNATIRGPAGTRADLFVQSIDNNGFDSYGPRIFFVRSSITLNASGAGVVALQGLRTEDNLRGFVHINDSAGNSISAQSSATRVSLMINAPCVYVELGNTSATTVTLTLSDAANAVVERHAFPIFGFGQVAFGFTHCFNRSIHIGDTFKVETTEGFVRIVKTPISAVHLDRARKTLTGRALPNRRIQLRDVYELRPNSIPSRATTTNATGDFGFDISDLLPYVNQNLWLDTYDDAGDRIGYQLFAAPYAAYLPVAARQ
jgi:hypothetical protein